MIIVTVLRKGREYDEKKVQWLHAQFPKNTRRVCLSDVDIPNVETIKLRYNWPGWWSKLELFDPLSEIGGEDLLFFDLDTVIVGDISNFMNQKEFTALSDFYLGYSIGSAVMYIPVSIKATIWDEWMKNPEQHMAECNYPEKNGDQGFIGSVTTAMRWQEVLPGEIVSYKVHVQRPPLPINEKEEKKKRRKNRIKNSVKFFLSFLFRKQKGIIMKDGQVCEKVKIVCFHGKPRPWDVEEPWIPKI